MQELDAFGNPAGTVYREDVCPPDLVCVPRETLDEMLYGVDMEYVEETGTIQPMGDAEAIIDFTTDLLFLRCLDYLKHGSPFNNIRSIWFDIICSSKVYSKEV